MSSQVQELLDGAKAGRWILPSPELPNPVSLVRAIAGICGAPVSAGVDTVADQLRELIGEPKHLVFIIADGFGMNFVNMLPEDSFSRSNLAVEGRAAFPSSTGPNMFSFGRVQWPGQHGVLGWYVHLAEINGRATLFPWVRTHDLKDLTELGLTGETVYPGTAEVTRFGRSAVNYIPSLFSWSIATGRMHGRETIVGYEGLPDAFDRVVSRIAESTESTYSHIFWPMIDKASHEFGTGHPKTFDELVHFDSQIAKMRDELPEDAVVVVTADHGHLDYTESGRIQFEQNDPLRTLLVDSPSGDERAVMFHVVEGMKDRFVSEFSSRFSENFMLLETRKVIELGLLGPDGVSDLAVGRLGDFLAISKNDTGMSFRDRPSTSGFTLVSQHGGLHPDEMLVPVIIA